MIQKRIELWDHETSSDGGRTLLKPAVDTYVLGGEKLRKAVLICPGGGYADLSKRESEPIAMQFNAAGMHAFVLNYTVHPDHYLQPLTDLSRAMCLIREHAEEWHVDKDKLAVCGFSAGGHLAASLGVYWNKSFLRQAAWMKPEGNRPDALILGYPVITTGAFAHKNSFLRLLGKDPDAALLSEMSLENQVQERTPPAFIWHTFEDALVPVENSLLFAKGLREKNIPFELHIFPKGVHGLSLANKETAMEGGARVEPHAANWMKLCIEWLEEVFQ